MYIVDFTGAKIELEMGAAARQVIVDLMLAVRMEGGVGIVDGCDSFKLEGHDWEDKEEEGIRRNIDAGQPAKYNLPWSAQDFAELSERFRTDRSATICSLATEFGRTPRSIQNQLQRMGLVDQYGTPLDRNTGEPRTIRIHGILGSRNSSMTPPCPVADPSSGPII